MDMNFLWWLNFIYYGFSARFFTASGWI